MNFSITENLNDESILNFILKDTRATIYHHPEWLRSIEKSFNYKAKYLVETDENFNVSGLLPFVEFNNKITANKIISFPMSTYCNPLFSDEKLPKAIAYLMSNYPDYKVIDLKTLISYKDSLHEFSVSQNYVTHILKLKESIDETFDSFHPTSVRASIRRAEKNKLDIIWGDSLNDLNIFYYLEFELRKRLLLPPIPYKFFKNVWIELRRENLISLPIVYKDKIPIAAGFILNFKDTFYLEYTASNRNYIGIYPNHKLFFEVIKKAHNSGANFVDFGRTSNENLSLIVFKEKWGAEKKIIFHYRYPSTSNTKQDQDKYKSLIKKINYYLPSSLLKLEGNLLYRYLL